MKSKTKNTPAKFRWGKAALLASCALLLANLQASAATIGVDLGADGFQTGSTIPPAQFNNAAAFLLGTGGGTILNMQNFVNLSGDVAVANGNISMKDSAKIQGRLSYKTTGTLTKTNSATITGTIYKNASTDSLLSAGVTAAINASNTAFGFARTSSLSNINNVNLTLSTAANTRAVYDLTNLTESGSYKLTLQGTATSAFVLNVTGNFSLTNNSSIVLSGGLTWNHVLYNVRGSGSVTLKDYGAMTGILLATSRNVSISNFAQLNGGVIANSLNMAQDYAKITRPPIVSP